MLVAVEDAGLKRKYALGSAAKLFEQPHKGIASTHIMRRGWSLMVSQVASDMNAPYAHGGDCTYAQGGDCTYALRQRVHTTQSLIQDMHSVPEA